MANAQLNEYMTMNGLNVSNISNRWWYIEGKKKRKKYGTQKSRKGDKKGGGTKGYGIVLCKNRILKAGNKFDWI
jgi:hypothetical protein